MTPDAIYGHLYEASAATAYDPFDRHVLACIFAAGVQECGSGVSLPDAVGIGGVQLRAAIERHFPGMLKRLKPLGLDGEPAVDADEQCLRELLGRFRSTPSSFNSLLATLVARRATRPNHLWQDLGLSNRGQLSSLMQRHFPLLAARNTQDMKWKKFFFRMICRDDAYRLCAAPCCSECSDFDACFGDETGESLLARVRLHAEFIPAAQIAPMRTV